MSEDLVRRLSLPRQVALVVAGLGGGAGAGLIGSLWATEPGPLPTRTHLAFGALVVIGLAWFAYAAWALARRPLFAVDRIVGGWLALGFSLATTVGTVAIAAGRGSTTGVVAATGVGVILTAAALVILTRARRYQRTLLARHRELTG